MTISTEAGYPITFRESDAKALGDHLKQHNSVVLIGMKRVGINNFLRFFLHHPQVQKTYIQNGGNHLFITVDLNDMVERDLFPFWTLVLKRLVDAIDASNLSSKIKEESKKLFVESIQLKDLFVTVDNVRKIVASIVDQDYYPTIVLNRFDRLKDAATPELFSNLQGIKEAAKRHLSYIFTSYRPLYELRSDVFPKSQLSVFSSDMYLKPATTTDMGIILETFEQRYQTTINPEVRGKLLTVSGGHAQYLHLSLLKVKDEANIPTELAQFIDFLGQNEEATMQSEELFESLTKKEQEALLAVHTGQNPGDPANPDIHYLWDSGMIRMEGNKPSIFSPLLALYLAKVSSVKPTTVADFTKKEHLLYTYLQSNEGALCERESIIEAVWPEYAEAGVSDWAIDRLIARVRSKLKAQNSPYEIVTVITRGYKLTKKE